MQNEHVSRDALEHVFETLYRPFKVPGAADSTVRQFHASLKNFAKHLGRPATLEDLHDHVLAAVAHAMIRRGLAPHSARKFQDNMVSIWRFAARRKLLDRWPELPLLQPPLKAPIAWLPDQLPRLFAACDEQTGMIGSVPAAIWWHNLHSVLWDTGERISAILATERHSLDLRSGWLTIEAKHRKGKRADNVVRLHKDTCSALEQMASWIPPGQKLLLPWPFDVGTLYHRYKGILRNADLPYDRSHKFHCLRRSTASYFEACGHDATKLLGHSSRKVTLRYLDPRIVGQTNASDVLFRPEGKVG